MSLLGRLLWVTSFFPHYCMLARAHGLTNPFSFFKQTALFVIPSMVILGWILDKPLALLFDPFESVVRSQNDLVAYTEAPYSPPLLGSVHIREHNVLCRCGRQVELARGGDPHV